MAATAASIDTMAARWDSERGFQPVVLRESLAWHATSSVGDEHTAWLRKAARQLEVVDGTPKGSSFGKKSGTSAFSALVGLVRDSNPSKPHRPYTSFDKQPELRRFVLESAVHLVWILLGEIGNGAARAGNVGGHRDADAALLL